MDIFNNKRIQDLEKELHTVKAERDRYKKQVDDLTIRIEEIGKLQENIPDDCEKGPWCRSCEFSRVFHYREYDHYSNWNFEFAYACGKGKSCKHFIERKVEE